MFYCEPAAPSRGLVPSVTDGLNVCPLSLGLGRPGTVDGIGLEEHWFARVFCVRVFLFLFLRDRSSARTRRNKAPRNQTRGSGGRAPRPLGAQPLEWQEGNNLEPAVPRRPQRRAKVPPSRHASPNEVFSLGENEMFCKMKQNEN